VNLHNEFASKNTPKADELGDKNSFKNAKMYNNMKQIASHDPRSPSRKEESAKKDLISPKHSNSKKKNERALPTTSVYFKGKVSVEDPKRTEPHPPSLPQPAPSAQEPSLPKSSRRGH